MRTSPQIKRADDGTDNGNDQNNNFGNACWVARAVYGEDNPDWRLFRHWLLTKAPAWFRSLYISRGEVFAAWLGDKPRTRSLIRRWMNRRIRRVQP